MEEIRLERLPPEAYPAYRRKAIFEACKWDPQIGDVNALCGHAVVLSPGAAERLASDAERLAAETAALDEAILRRPDLHRELGLNRALRGALRGALRRTDGRLPEQVRLMRFDFHPTADGWAVSEVNSDVPGGFGEAAVLPRLAAALLPGTVPAGPDPAAAVARAFAARLPAGSRIALVHCTAYSDDRQVMEFIARACLEAGLRPLMAAPDHLRRRGGRWECVAGGQEGPVHGVFRFFPAEWLPNLPAGWRDYFQPGPPACNHPLVLLTQSKRAPLLWDRLGVPVPAWRALLPETVDPRRADWQRDGNWVLKPALGRVGEDIGIREVLSPKEWKGIRRNARRHPRQWVAQRRFRSRPVPTGGGDRHLCVGVYTVDGKAAGFYARVASRPRIDQYAEDAPVLTAGRDA